MHIDHLPTGVSAQAGERRSQIENKFVAIERLRLNLAIYHRAQPATPPKIVGRTVDEFLAVLDAQIGGAGKPIITTSDLWRSRLTTSKAKAGRISCNPTHRDFPALLAEAMDVLAFYDWEPRPAAERLGVTTSQLIKFVKDAPEAFGLWNAERFRRGLHSMK